MTAAEFLAESKRIEDAATEGPWRTMSPRSDGRNAVERPRYDLYGNEVSEFLVVDTNPDDAAFIAHARTTLPKMREALEAVLAIHSVKHGESPRYAPDDLEHEREPVSWEPYTVCQGCSASPYPCRTVRAIESALAGKGGGS